MIELAYLKPCLETAEVQALLFALIGWRADEAHNRAALERVTAEYRDRTELRLYGAYREGRLTGLVGLEATNAADLEIRHLVVHPARRAAGTGRALITVVCETWRPSRLTAETDASAVDFYRRCGFSVWSLGEKYPGVERFRCVLERTDRRTP